MGISVAFLDDAGVVEMLFTGANPSLQDIEAAMTEAGSLGAEHLANRYLVDVREMAFSGKAFDILALGEFLASLPPGLIEREAVVLPTEEAAMQEFEFFETVCRNRGMNVRVFGERDDALAWLTA